MDHSKKKIKKKKIKFNDSLKQHLLNIYTSFALWMLFMSIGIVTYMSVQVQSLAIIAGVFSILFAKKLWSLPYDQEKQLMKLLLYLCTGYFTGFAMGMISELFCSIDSHFFVTIFLTTALVCLSFSISVLYVNECIELFVGGIFTSGFTVMLLCFSVNFFFPNIYQFNLYVGAFIVCMYNYLNTKIVMEKYTRGDDDYLRDSFALISIFRDAWNRFDLFSFFDPFKSSNTKKSLLKHSR